MPSGRSAARMEGSRRGDARLELRAEEARGRRRGESVSSSARARGESGPISKPGLQGSRCHGVP